MGTSSGQYDVTRGRCHWWPPRQVEKLNCDVVFLGLIGYCVDDCVIMTSHQPTRRHNSRLLFACKWIRRHLRQTSLTSQLRDDDVTIPGAVVEAVIFYFLFSSVTGRFVVTSSVASCLCDVTIDTDAGILFFFVYLLPPIVAKFKKKS